MPALDFYFDYRSPYAYLAQTQVRRLGLDASYHPVDLRKLMQEVGNVATSITCKPKNRYVMADLLRWVRDYGVAFQLHPQSAQIDSRRLLRATLAAAEMGKGPQAVGAIFDALWRFATPLSTPENVAAVLSGVGLDRAALLAAIDTPELDEALDQSTAAAIERGVFGAPTMFVDDEMFFGNDRLDFVRRRMGVAA